MPLINPDEKPREFLITVIAAMRYVLAPQDLMPGAALDEVEKFVAEAERRYGKIEPEA